MQDVPGLSGGEAMNHIEELQEDLEKAKRWVLECQDELEVAKQAVWDADYRLREATGKVHP